MYQHGPNMPDILVWKNEMTTQGYFSTPWMQWPEQLWKGTLYWINSASWKDWNLISYGLTQMETKLHWSEHGGLLRNLLSVYRHAKTGKSQEYPHVIPPCPTSHGGPFQKRQLGNHTEYLGVAPVRCSKSEQAAPWAGRSLFSHLCRHVEEISYALTFPLPISV